MLGSCRSVVLVLAVEKPQEVAVEATNIVGGPVCGEFVEHGFLPVVGCVRRRASDVEAILLR